MGDVRARILGRSNLTVGAPGLAPRVGGAEAQRARVVRADEMEGLVRVRCVSGPRGAWRGGGFYFHMVIEKTLKVRNRLGLHARPAALFVQTAGRFRCQVK